MTTIAQGAAGAEGAQEWDAASYHRVSNPHVTWGAGVLARLPTRGDETALDAGCGTGRLTAELLERLPGGRVIAVDRSANMLDAAREHLSPRFGDRVSFRQMDLQSIDRGVLGEEVDLVFSTATFHWIPDHPRLFAGLASLLRPGGHLVAQCGGGPNIARLRARAATLQDAPEFAPHFAGWPGPWTFADDVTTAARLAAAGFDGIGTGRVADQTILADAAAYREFLATVVLGQHLARLPDDELRTRFVDALTVQAATDAPAFMLDYWRLNMHARRRVGE
ncbi:MAG: class I SAM-dependent methyltransferase [Thermomicrobiales bacterium]